MLNPAVYTCIGAVSGHDSHITINRRYYRVLIVSQGIREAAKRYFFLVAQSLRGGRGGGMGLATKKLEKKLF